MARAVKTINFNITQDPKIIELVNQFASAQRLKPTTALKRFLLDMLPSAITQTNKKEERGQG